MTASILDGKLVAAHMKEKIKHEVVLRVEQGKRPPGLAVILIGENNPASTLYVRNKCTACIEVGFKSFAYNLPADTTEKELLTLIETLNHSDEVHGILVQLPLPAHIHAGVVIENISPHKDVDGFHPYNIGRLAQGNPWLRPCTPWGVMMLLRHYHLSLVGKHAVVVGKSNIVGRPMALEFLLANVTVTNCSRATRNLEKHIRMADIVVVATGTADVLDTEWLNSSQILVDVGMHRTPEGKIRGDVDFESAKHKVAWITPVPGGVGPMTISTLLQNTLFAANHVLIT